MIATYTRLGDRGLALMLALVLAGLPASTAAAAPPPAGGHDDAAGETTTAPEPATRNPAAEAALAEAALLLEQGKHAQAIAKADLAAELDPTWSEPVRLRAEAFAALAERYEPSAAFASAHATELEHLLALEPGVDVEARQRQAAALRQQAREAHELEQRRRKLDLPAFMLAIVATGLFASGAMLYGMKPRESLVPASYRQERRDRAGIVLMTAGGVLIPPAIALGVISARQTRRDAAVRDLEIETGRPRARLGIGLQFVRSGGGAGLTLRF